MAARRILGSLSVLFAIILLPSPGQSAPNTIDELKAAIQQILDEHRIPGASVALVSRNEVLWAGGVGRADLANERDVTAHTLFRVGSISKSFTALAVMTLVEDKKIDLNANVRKLVPDVAFTNRWADTHPITVAMTMEHTTGFDDIRVREYAKIDEPEITLFDSLAYHPASRNSRWKPGMHMSYCNSGPAIAAYIVQNVTDQRFEDYVRKHVFEPLDMNESTWFFPKDESRMAKGYKRNGVSEANYDHIIDRPSGSLNASAKDMANYLRMMLNRGQYNDVQILLPESIERMETPTTTLAARAGHTSFGYGLGNYSSIIHGHLFRGHDGGITGFASTSAYSEALGVGFFISINRPAAQLKDIRNLVAAYLIQGTEPPKGPAMDLDEPTLENFTGYYQRLTPRQELTRFMTRLLEIRSVQLEDGKLFVGPVFGGPKKALIPVTPTSFRHENEPVATHFFVTDGDDLILQQSFGANSRKISTIWMLVQLMTAAACLLLLLSSVLLGLIWVFGRRFGQIKAWPIKIAVWPLLTTLSLIFALVVPFAISDDPVQDFGHPTMHSMLLYLGTLLFAALTPIGLYKTIRFKNTKAPRWIGVHARLASLAGFLVLLYLWNHGLIGIKTWLY